MATLAGVIIRDIFANRPAAGIAGRLFFSSDTGEFFHDNGTSWDVIVAGPGIAPANKGRATLSSGTVSVSAAAVGSSSVIMLTNVAPSSVIGALTVGTITAGTGFVINSTDAADTSTVAWAIL